MSGHIMLRILTLLMVCCLHTYVAFCFEVSIITSDVKCHGNSDGTIELVISGFSPEFTIKLYDKPPAVKQKTLNVITTSDTAIVFNNLSAKKYYITILDAKNEYYTREVIIKEPEAISYEGFSIKTYPSTDESCDGSILIKAMGGTPPYTFTWSAEANNQKTELAQNLAYGIYNCKITDANNCGPLRPSIIFRKKPETE